MGRGNVMDEMPSLAPYFLTPWSLVISSLNVSVDAQTSLYIGTLQQLSLLDMFITALGDVGNLMGLALFQASILDLLPTLPTYLRQFYPPVLLLCLILS